MSLSLMIYLASIADNVITCCRILFGCAAITIFFAWGMSDSFDDATKKTAKKFFKIGSAILLFVIPLSLFCPDQKTIYLIAAESAGEHIAANPTVQKIEDKMLTILNQKLDELGAKK